MDKLTPDELNRARAFYADEKLTREEIETVIKAAVIFMGLSRFREQINENNKR